MSFQNSANLITTYLQTLADTNNYEIRYDNDPRPTPTENLWLECKIEFGNSEQIELGIDSFRNSGDLIIIIKNSVGLGTGELFETAVVITDAFTSVDVDSITFRVPSISEKGRVEDNWEFEIICPFYINEN